MELKGISVKNEVSTNSHFLTVWGIRTAKDQMFIKDSDDCTNEPKKCAYDRTACQLDCEGRNVLKTFILGLEVWGAGDPDPTPRQDV